MLNALYASKAGQSFGNKPDWKNSFIGSEDSLTSCVIERLIYLPDETLWKFIQEACYGNSLPRQAGKLVAYEFWPKWSAEDTDNTSFVEPDVFLRFEKFDLIIEAKRYDEKQQNEVQWGREITGYRNEYSEGKCLHLIALGGLHKYEESKISGITITMASWSKMLLAIQNYLEVIARDESFNFEVRILQDAVAAFELHGYSTGKWLNTLNSQYLKEMNLDKDPRSVEDMLVEVRGAYRLLHDYQRRIMDTIKYIEGVLECKFTSGWPKFSNEAKRKEAVKLEHWAWDWLGMYEYDFHFGEWNLGGENLTLSIIHQADSGFYDTKSDIQVDKTYPERFLPSERSVSRFIFVVSCSRDSWHVDYTELIQKGVQRSEIEESYAGGGGMFSKSYSIAEFANRDKAISALNDFKTWVSEKFAIHD